jgi:hypothetical protein
VFTFAISLPSMPALSRTRSHPVGVDRIVIVLPVGAVLAAVELFGVGLALGVTVGLVEPFGDSVGDAEALACFHVQTF